MLFVAMCLPNGNLLGQLRLHDDLLEISFGSTPEGKDCN